MTPEEHRQLDAEIAAKVFGITVIGEAPCGAPDGYWHVHLNAGPDSGCVVSPVYQKIVPDLWAGDTGPLAVPKLNGVSEYALAPVPEYSTEIAAAWEVAEKLAAKGHRLILEDHRDNPHSPGWWARFDLANGHDTGDVVAATAPLAICRAALKAVGVN